jgi:hypothetical protein
MTYQPHKACIAPAEDDVLWRYMDLTRFIGLLETASLFFCRADLFQDAFEGSLTQGNIEQRESLGPPDLDDPLYIDVPYRKMPEWTAINCWSCLNFESAAMWALYCPEGPGIAVRTTFAHLCEALAASEQLKVAIGKVTYVDYDEAVVPEGHLLAPFLHKRQSFEHEHEVRALIQRMPDSTMVDRPSPFERLGGIHVDVTLDTLIERIYVSPTAPEWYSELVERVAHRYRVAAKVHQSSLAGDPLF